MDVKQDPKVSATSGGPSYYHPTPPPPYKYPPNNNAPIQVQPVTLVRGPGVTYVQNVPAGPREVVITSNVSGVILQPVMGHYPSTMQCRSCNAHIVTRVEQTTTVRTHLVAMLLCLFGCWPCVCLPYCMDSCKNSEHYCPNCGAFNGSSSF